MSYLSLELESLLLMAGFESLAGEDFIGKARDLIAISQVRVTVWGFRVIEVSGYRGSVSLSYLLKELEQKASRVPGDAGVTLAQRVAYHNMVINIEAKIGQAGAQLSTACHITQIFHRIWVFLGFEYGSAEFSSVCASTKYNFRSFTAEEYRSHGFVKADHDNTVTWGAAKGLTLIKHESMALKIISALRVATDATPGLDRAIRGALANRTNPVVVNALATQEAAL